MTLQQPDPPSLSGAADQSASLHTTNSTEAHPAPKPHSFEIRHYKFYIALLLPVWIATAIISGPMGDTLGSLVAPIPGLTFWAAAMITVGIMAHVFRTQLKKVLDHFWNTNDTKELAAYFGGVVALFIFLFHVVSGQFSENLVIKFSATESSTGGADVTIDLEKGDSGSLRLLDVVVFKNLRDKKGLLEMPLDEAFIEVDDESNFGPKLSDKLKEKGSMRLTVSPGDKANFAFHIDGVQRGDILDLAILARKHPFHTLWYYPQWRASCVVGTPTPRPPSSGTPAPQ